MLVVFEKALGTVKALPKRRRLAGTSDSEGFGLFLDSVISGGEEPGGYTIGEDMKGIVTSVSVVLVIVVLPRG